MESPSPDLLAECTRILGPVRVAELYLAGLSGAYRDRDSATFQALSFTERLVAWDGEHDAAAAASRARATAAAEAREAARAERCASEAARVLEIAQFLAENPGIDLSSIRPRVYPSYTYLPGQECEFCHGNRDGSRCLGSPECLFRYRAGFFTRQGGRCPWCGLPLPADLSTRRPRDDPMSTVAIDHVIPLTRGGPRRAEWNKQLVHRKCNSSKGNWVTAVALALAAEHGAEVLDFLAICPHPGPLPRDAEVHLMTPLRWDATHGVFHSSLDRIGHRFRALCSLDLGMDWFQMHGSPLPVTCQRCRQRRERLGPGTAPACPGDCCRF
jgi:hypothetical protein